MVPIFTVITGALEAKTVAKFVQIRGHFSSRLWPNQCSTEIDLKQAAMLKAENISSQDRTFCNPKEVPLSVSHQFACGIHIGEQQGN